MPALQQFPPHDADTGAGRGFADGGVHGQSAPGELDRLVPAARLPERARLRVGVGAAVVLLLAGLVATVVVSAVGQQSGARTIAAATSGPAEADEAAGAPGEEGGGSAAGLIIFVHVLGAVERPGLFELPEGARVIDAVAAAGGMTDSADPAGTNLARRLSDGEQLYLPQVGEVPTGPTGGAAGLASGQGGTGNPAALVVNLNTATVADLDTLPRIGPAMAQRILDYRDTNGPFTTPDELRNITGIGDKTFEALKDLVTV